MMKMMTTMMVGFSLSNADFSVDLNYFVMLILTVSLANIIVKQKAAQPKLAADFKRKSNKNQWKLLARDEQLIRKYIQLTCYACAYMAKSCQDLYEHFLQIHEEAKAYVSCCNEVLNTRPKILNHARKHENPDMFK